MFQLMSFDNFYPCLTEVHYLVNQHWNIQWQQLIRKMNEIHKNAFESEYSNISSIHWLPKNIIYTKGNHRNKKSL